MLTASMASSPATAYNLIPARDALGVIAQWDLLTEEERAAEIDNGGAPITEAQVQQFVDTVKRHVILGVYPYVTEYIIPHDGTAPCYRMGDLLVVGSKL